MVGTQPAIRRTRAHIHRHIGRVSPLPVRPVPREPAVHRVRPKVELLRLPVLGARLRHEDLVVSLKHDGGQNPVTVGANRLRLPDEVPLCDLLPNLQTDICYLGHFPYISCLAGFAYKRFNFFEVNK